MRISLIAAIGNNRELGFHGELPWEKLPDDWKYFQETTTWHAVLMGRKTYESIGHALKNRTNIVVSRQENYHAPGCIVFPSIEEAVTKFESEELFIIGGAQIYSESIGIAQRMHLTHVKGNFPADTFFPEFNESEWEVTKSLYHPQDTRHAHEFTIKTYDRKKGKEIG